MAKAKKLPSGSWRCLVYSHTEKALDPIMQRGGWGSDGTLKAVYRHTLDDREKEMSSIANEHFKGLCNTRYNTKTKNP